MLLLVLMTSVLQSAAPLGHHKPLTADDATRAAAKEEAAKAFICRNEVVTGTRFTHKVCRRKEEFAEKAAEEQQRLRTMQRPQYDCHNLNNGVC